MMWKWLQTLVSRSVHIKYQTHILTHEARPAQPVFLSHIVSLSIVNHDARNLNRTIILHNIIITRPRHILDRLRQKR